MAATYLFRKLGEQFSDANGYPLAGYKLYYYISGTDTLLDTYDLRTGAAVTNANPLTLDSAGRLPSPVFLGSTYNYTESLQDANGVPVAPWPCDNIPKAEVTATAAAGLQKLYLPWAVVTHGPQNLATTDYGNAYEYDCTAGSITVNLPSAGAIQEGTGFCLKKIDSTNNVVNVTPFGTETIDAVAGVKQMAKGDVSLWIISDGANWQVSFFGAYFQKLIVSSSAITATPQTISETAAGYAYEYDCTAGNITVNLPSATLVQNGTGFYLRKTDASLYLVIVKPTGAETIDGTYTSASPFYIKNIGDGIWLISNGTTWHTVSVGSSSVYSRNTAGQIGMFPGSTPPTGWLEANGALVSRADYPALWRYAAACSNTVSDATWSSTYAYGAFSTGNGTTTFRLPDLRGYFLRSWASNATGSLDYGRVVGAFEEQAGLSHTHTGTTGTESAIHTHVYQGASASAGGPGGSGGYMVNAHNVDTGQESASHTHSFTSNATGGTQNIPQNIALLTCISFI